MKYKTYKRKSNQKLKKLRNKSKEAPLLKNKIFETLKLIKYSDGFFDIDLFEKIINKAREKPNPFKTSLEEEKQHTLIPSARAVSNNNFHEGTTSNSQKNITPAKPNIYRKPSNRWLIRKNKSSNIFRKKYTKIKTKKAMLQLIPKNKKLSTSSQESFQPKTSVFNSENRKSETESEEQNADWWDTVKNILYYINSVLFE